MKNQCNFNSVTKEYLNEYYCILDNMIYAMTSAELTNSISHNFIVQMIPHHHGAIEMSENVLRFTTDSTIQNMATNIIRMQTQGIKNMLNIKCPCSTLSNSRQALNMYQRQFQKISKLMLTQMGNACSTNNINANFIREMIPHHRGAIFMSQNALRFDICPELIPMLNEIITTQQKEIQEMNCLLRYMN